MKRYDNDVLTAIGICMIFGLLFWAVYSILSVAYAHGTRVEPVNYCVTESGHKRVPCPGESDG